MTTEYIYDGLPNTVCLADKFTGKERDAESGLDYFGARYYASSMGRWLSPDWSARAEPVPYAKLDNPQSLNLYSYALNNPLRNVDTDGHSATCGGNDGSSCTVTVTTVSQNVNFYDNKGNVTSTVNVTTSISTVSNSISGAVVSANATNISTTNVSGLAFNSSQLSTIGSTVAAVQGAGASMALGANPTQLLTAITAKESTLGIAAPNNPLQLSCSSGQCPNGNRSDNVAGALNVLQDKGRRSNFDPGSTYGRYNGVGGVQGAENVRMFNSIYNGMSQSTSSYSPSIPTPPLPPGLQ